MKEEVRVYDTTMERKRNHRYDEYAERNIERVRSCIYHGSLGWTRLMVFEGVNRTRAVRANLGNAFAPAGSVCRDILHAFVFVNESSTPESVCGQCAAARRSCRAREHGCGCNAGNAGLELCAWLCL